MRRRGTARGSAVRPWSLLLGAALVAVGLLGCGKSGAPTSTYELSGYVHDAESGQALNGVQVTFTSDTLYTATATTGSDGLYEMALDSDTPFGEVKAEAGGYAPAEKTVYFDTPTRRMDLDLRPAPPAM